jgi:hypothetical protein
MASFLAERYQPEPTTGDAVTVWAASERSAAEAMAIRHVTTIYVPADETCFALFEAPSREVVIDTIDRFTLGYSRVVLAISVGSSADAYAPRE